jgi:hypothetical protein
VRKRIKALAAFTFAFTAIAIVMMGGVRDAGSTEPRASHDGLAVEPIAASTTVPTESSVLIAMGHLAQPANTFWELFVRKAGDTSWVLDTPPGVASNGGLVASAPPTGALTIGFLVSADLKFSPVARASQVGTTWSGGELPFPLTAVPDALAVGPAGDTLALVGKNGESIVMSADLSTWHAVTTTKALARATSTCARQRVTAVAYTAGSQPLLGLACARAARIGILTPADSSGAQPSGWHAVGPSLPTSGNAASVIRLVSTATGPVGLAQLGSVTRMSLVAFWDQGSTLQWSTSGTLPVPSGWSVKATATGGGGGQGVAVLLGSGDHRRVEEVTAPDALWANVPDPPRGASGVSIVGTEINTFVVRGSDLAVWAWSPGSSGWHRTAAIVVPVPYESSS